MWRLWPICLVWTNTPFPKLELSRLIPKKVMIYGVVYWINSVNVKDQWQNMNIFVLAKCKLIQRPLSRKALHKFDSSNRVDLGNGWLFFAFAGSPGNVFHSRSFERIERAIEISIQACVRFLIVPSWDIDIDVNLEPDVEYQSINLSLLFDGMGQRPFQSRSEEHIRKAAFDRRWFTYVYASLLYMYFLF